MKTHKQIKRCIHPCDKINVVKIVLQIQKIQINKETFQVAQNNQTKAKVTF